MRVSVLENRAVSILLCIIPLVLYIIFFESIAVNANYIAYDDIHVLQIIDQWYHATSFAQKLDFLTEGFPEHRIVFTRSIVLLSYWFTGGVNLKNLMLISNLIWVSQLGILYWVFRKRLKFEKYSLVYFAPICWLLLSVQAFENIFWATSSLGNFGVLFFTMLAGYFYTSDDTQKHLPLALLFSLVATFSYGNGLMTFVIGGFIFALKREWRHFFVILFTFLVVGGLYALTRSSATPKPLDLTKPESYFNIIPCFLAFLGSSANVDVYLTSNFAMWASVVWGGIFVGFILWFLSKGVSFKSSKITLKMNSFQLFILFLFLFIGLTAAGVVYKRSGWDKLIGMFKGRYRMYPMWATVLFYFSLLYLIKDKKRWFLPVAIVVSILFNLAVLYYAIAPAVNNRRIAVAQEFNSTFNQDLLGIKMFDISGEYFLKLQSLYKPHLFYEDLHLATKDTLQIAETMRLDSVYFDKAIFTVYHHQDFIRPSKDFDDGAYIILKSTTHTYMLAGIQRALPLKTFFRRGWYWDRGFSANVHKDVIEKGRYQLLVLRRQGGVSKLYDTERRFDF